MGRSPTWRGWEPWWVFSFFPGTRCATRPTRGMALPAIEKAFNMNEYRDWDRTEHLSWTADTIYRELKGEGPQAVQTTEKRISGVVSKAVQDGRCVTGKGMDGTETQLRITADTDVAGIADRTLVRAGMKLSALYQ